MQLSGLELADTAATPGAANSSGYKGKQVRRFLATRWPVWSSDKGGFAVYDSKTSPVRGFGISKLCQPASVSASSNVFFMAVSLPAQTSIHTYKCGLGTMGQHRRCGVRARPEFDKQFVDFPERSVLRAKVI